jgi:hypothetical protein
MRVERRPSNVTDTVVQPPPPASMHTQTGSNFDQQAITAMNTARQRAQGGLAAAAGVTTVTPNEFKQSHQSAPQEIV